MTEADGELCLGESIYLFLLRAIKRLNHEKRLLIANVIYVYNNEYYCVLSGNQMMKFSFQDIELVEKHTWHAKYNPDTDSFYAVTRVGATKKSYSQLLFPNMKPGESGDHLDGGTLDNTRENLRAATAPQQSANQKMRSDNKSGYTGVLRNSRDTGWVAQWTGDDGIVRLYFSDIEYRGKENAKLATIAAREEGIRNSKIYAI